MPRHIERTNPVVFRIKPEPRRTLYVRVHIWPTAAAMRAHKRSTGLSGAWNTAAYCTQITQRQYRRGTPMRTRPIVAEVHFSRNRLSQVIVAHELFHATLAYGRRVG